MILTILGIASAIATPIGIAAAAIASVIAAYHAYSANQVVQGMKK
jgi:hypothetical protein